MVANLHCTNSDAPIQTHNEDLLKRTPFAQKIAKYINEIPASESIVLGIQGQWGSGKTSLINLITEALNSDDSENTVVIRFNPWNYTQSEKVFENFFDHISKECRKAGVAKIPDKTTRIHLETIGNAFAEFASSALFTLRDQFLVAAIAARGIDAAKTALSSLKDESTLTLEDAKEKVANALKEEDCKLLVVVDDVDRLGDESIRTIFRLVAAVANIPGVSYLLAYDHRIVSRALDSLQVGEGASYIEKVVQAPFSLPAQNEQCVSTQLLQVLEQMESLHHDDSSPSYDNHARNIIWTCIIPFISSLRELARFQNVLSLELEIFQNKINFFDLAAIVCLKMKYPALKDHLCTIAQYKARANTLDLRYVLSDKSTFELNVWWNQTKEMGGEKLVQALRTLIPILSRDAKMSETPRDYARSKDAGLLCCLDLLSGYLDGTLASEAFSIYEIKRALRLSDNCTITPNLKTLQEKGHLEEALNLIRDQLPNLPIEKKQQIAFDLISGDLLLLPGEQEDSLFSTDELQLYLLHDLLKTLDVATAIRLVKESLISPSSSKCMPIRLIHLEEVRHGVFGDVSSTHPDNWLFDDAELKEIEGDFIQNIPNILKSDILETNSAPYFRFLLEKNAPSFLPQYASGANGSPHVLTLLLRTYTSTWSSSSGNDGYLIDTSFDTYLTSDIAKQCIDEECLGPAFWSFPERWREEVAAVYLYLTGHTKKHPVTADQQVTSRDCVALLAKWRKAHFAS